MLTTHPLLTALLTTTLALPMATEGTQSATDIARDVTAATRAAAAEARTASAAARTEVRAVRYQGRRDSRFRQTEQQTRTAKIGASGTIELRNIAGDISVAAGSGDTATIEIIKVARGSSDADAREQLGLVTVDVVEGNGRVEVVARYPDDRRRGNRRNIDVSTVYRVTAPAGARLKVESISGDVEVSGIHGEITLNSISGDITVERAGKIVKATSISGNVELVSATQDAAVELSSTSGNITARNLTVRRIDMGSISGNIRATDLTCDTAELHTMSGDVEYTGGLTRNGSYKFRTHSGNVRLTLGGGTGFELEASTFSGEVRTGLDLRLEGVSSRRNRTIRATYGDGAARIEATSFSGTVVINGR